MSRLTELRYVAAQITSKPEGRKQNASIPISLKNISLDLTRETESVITVEAYPKPREYLEVGDALDGVAISGSALPSVLGALGRHEVVGVAHYDSAARRVHFAHYR